MRIQYLGHSCLKSVPAGMRWWWTHMKMVSVPGLKNLDTMANLYVFSHEHW